MLFSSYDKVAGMTYELEIDIIGELYNVECLHTWRIRSFGERCSGFSFVQTYYYRQKLFSYRKIFLLYMFLPFKNLIYVDRDNRTSIYKQVSNEIIRLIREGKIIPGAFLPGTREMAEQLSIHRKTIINAYDELASQGWIESLPRKGYQVVPDLPVIKPRSFHPKNNFPTLATEGDGMKQMPVLLGPGKAYAANAIIVDDGFPDTSLTPYESFIQQYKKQFHSGDLHRMALEQEQGGLFHLRSSTAGFLNQTRGLNITQDHIMMTRGAQMAIYIAAALMIQPGDNIIVSDPSYFMADHIFQQRGAIIHRVSVDEDGMKTAELAELLQTSNFKLLYVIPHHHHPTTVTMSAARRLQLLTLVKQYQLWVDRR